jgi:hypothetical protein
LVRNKVKFNFHFSVPYGRIFDTLFKARESVGEGSFQIRLRKESPLRLRSKRNFRRKRFVAFVGEAVDGICVHDFYEINLGRCHD